MPADPIKVYDARWENDEFTDDQIRRLFAATLAYGRLLDVDTVVITRDGRNGAGHVMELGLEVALRMGFRTFLRTAPISTPQSYFTILSISQDYRRTMGLTITASHNPKQYVGIKFTLPIVQAIGEDCGPLGGLTKIRELYHTPQDFPAAGGGTLELVSLAHEYITFSMKQTSIRPGDLRGLRVVLDSFNGAAGPELHMALTVAGVDVVPIRLVPDGNFPTGSPNPTSRGKMDRAVALCAEQNCDALIGVDGDGDRIVFGDRRGILTAGFAFVPILRACGIDPNARTPAPVLYDPKVSPLALAEWGKLNAQPVLFRNGHSQIKDYMTRIGALAAAEESGHYYHRIRMGELTISAENSIMTILLFLGALKKQERLMDRLWELQDRVCTTGEFNYQFDSDATRDRALEAVVAHFVADGAQTVTATPDGIDLQGTCLSKGVTMAPGAVRLSSDWYSGYLRIATNEKSVVRSYFSAPDLPTRQCVEAQARQILQQQFGGKVIE